MGQVDRGELKAHRVIVRLDIWSMYVNGDLEKHMIIDLASVQAQKRFFKKGMDAYGRYVADNFHHIHLSSKASEVLLKWRGKILIDYFEVVDDTGKPLRMLKALLEEARGPQRMRSVWSEQKPIAPPPIAFKAPPTPGRGSPCAQAAMGVSGSSGVFHPALSQAPPCIPPMPTRPPPCASVLPLVVKQMPVGSPPFASDGMKASNANFAASEVGNEKREPENALTLAAGYPVVTSSAVALTPSTDESWIEPVAKWAKACLGVGDSSGMIGSSQALAVISPVFCPPPAQDSTAELSSQARGSPLWGTLMTQTPHLTRRR